MAHERSGVSTMDSGATFENLFGWIVLAILLWLTYRKPSTRAGVWRGRLLRWVFRFLLQAGRLCLLGLWHVVVLLMRFFWWLLLRIARRTPGIHGNAAFMGWWQRRRLLSRRHDGLVIDGRRRIRMKNSFSNAVILAPTGAGKTTSYIMPNVLQLANVSMVITDPAGEIFKVAEPYLRSQGYAIKVLNCADPDHSLQFNPLCRVESFTDIGQISEILVESAYGRSSGDQSFWNNGAKSIINVLTRYVKTQDTADQTLHQLWQLLNMFGADQKEIDHLMATHLDADTFQEYKAFASQSPKVLQGMISTARNALYKLSDPTIQTLTARETLHFQILRSEKTALFVIVPEDQIPYYGFLLNLFYTQVFSYCMNLQTPGEPYYPIFFLLDEFGNMALPNFPQIITTLRKRHCSISLVLQDAEQLTTTYGRAGASTILNGGISSRIYYPGLPIATCYEIEKMLGRQTVRYRDPAMGSQAKPRDVGRALMMADEVRTMSDTEALFVHANKQPVKLTVLPYYRNRALLRRIRRVRTKRTGKKKYWSLFKRT